jgi:hypothetical protein
MKTMPPAGTPAPGWRKTLWACPLPLVAVARRQPSRPAGPHQTAKPMRFDPSSPGLLNRLPDDGDGMGQAPPHPCAGAPLKKGQINAHGTTGKAI